MFTQRAKSSLLQIIFAGALVMLVSSCGHEDLSSSPAEHGASTAGMSRANKALKSRTEEKASASVGVDEILDWPVDTARLSRGFSADPTGRARKPHLGIDLAAPKGTPIYSAQEGTVIYTGQDFHGYGKMILIEGRQGLATLYAHLSKIIIHEGDQVSRGTLIGAMGRTGHATGVHLHFEVRKDRGAVDPLLYLPATKLTKNIKGLRPLSPVDDQEELEN